MGFYMYKTGFEILGQLFIECAIRTGFCTVLYAIIAYRVEALTKQSFIGRETSEKAFHRWMKIFSTFSEGTVLVRNQYILGANTAVQLIINYNPMDPLGNETSIRDADQDPNFEFLRDDLN